MNMISVKSKIQWKREQQCFNEHKIFDVILLFNYFENIILYYK